MTFSGMRGAVSRVGFSGARVATPLRRVALLRRPALLRGAALLRRAALLLLLCICLAASAGCQGQGGGQGGGASPPPTEPPQGAVWPETLTAAFRPADAEAPDRPEENGRTWYQVFVYSFFDSDGDGIGDLAGVTLRLDYIQDMGFDGIWLSPIHPSNTYHKYDVKDYLDIDPQYGDLEDFDVLVAACRDRGLKILLDLVINHSALAHPWFTEHPEYYHIEDSPGNGSWKQLPDGRYYECQFWDQMPDLNLDSPAVREEIAAIAAFWLDRGADGFRLDAVKEYESGNAARNIEILGWLTRTVKGIDPDAYLVCENWDTTSGLYDYYESGADSFFAFPFAGADGAIAKTLLQSAASLDDYLQKVASAQQAIASRNPAATDAPFFTNHDMSRAAGFLRRDPDLIKTAWGMSLMQPGDAFVYYGEELGMSGSGRDENKRAPMFWTSDRNAAGMTYGPPGMESVSHSFPPADEQIWDSTSLHAYVKQAVQLRAKYPQIGRGSFEVLPAGDAGGKRVGAAVRDWQGEAIAVAYNISPDEASLTLPGWTWQDALSVTGEHPTQDGDELILPGYTIAVLTGGP